jgi:mRNA-degrading endonuclease toxin of MazEF toxin-antitoxin module
MSQKVKRGEIWLANLKDDDDFPVIVISADDYNMLEPSTVLVLPVFSTGSGLPSRIQIQGAGVNLDAPAFAACDQIRSIKRDRLKQAVGMVAEDTLKDAERALTRLIGLKPMPQPRGWGR